MADVPVTFAFAVLGAGRQGTAAAFDLVVRGSAASVALGDIDEGAARAAAERVNRLSGSDIARGGSVDVCEEDAVAAFLAPVDGAVSAVPYWLNLGVTRAALQAGTSVCDLGGSMAVVRSQLELDAAAREQGICLIPDCGEAPGMGNNVMARAIDLLREAGADPQDLILYDGGIPLEPKPPWNYEVTFNIDGLTNEYDGTTTFVIDGAPTDVACLDPAEYETLDFGEPFGVLEAFPAATSSTTPWTLGAGLRTLRSKVLRYPGHAAQWLAFRDAGLFGQEPIEVDGTTVVPRQLFHALIEPRIRATEGAGDVVIARAIATDGDGRRATVDVRVYPDVALGFTAMERATGWHAAIVCHRMASRKIASGATPVELAVPAGEMMEELRLRGFEVDERVETTRAEP